MLCFQKKRKKENMSLEVFKRETVKSFESMNKAVFVDIPITVTTNGNSVVAKYENSYLKFEYVSDTTALVSFKAGRGAEEEEYGELDAMSTAELLQMMTQVYVHLMVLIIYLVGDASVSTAKFSRIAKNSSR
jgi:hypothetical protein